MKDGDWWFVTDRQHEKIGIGYLCPCGCGQRGFVAFVRIDGHPIWDWDSNTIEPTLSPSIQRNTPCRWHGHLVRGVFVPC